MTGSPVLVGDTVITGVSANNAGGPTSTFRGAIVALDAQTGEILWQTYSLPDNGGVPTGYAGATMFSPPAVDESLGLVYGTFGQPYRKPASVDACNAAAPGGFSESCEQPGAFLKSIVAFDLKTGAPRWSYRVLGHAPWQRACGAPAADGDLVRAEADGEKWDLGGSGANVFQLRSARARRDVVGVGEKSGVYILLDAKTGEFVWNTLVGPGGDQGGFEWGTAYDGDRIYGSITNQHHIPYQLTQNGVTSGPFVTGGSWAALDPETGKILWQTADPVERATTSAPGDVGERRRLRVVDAADREPDVRARRARPARSSGSTRPAARSTPARPSSTAPSTGARATTAGSEATATTSSSPSASTASNSARSRAPRLGRGAHDPCRAANHQPMRAPKARARASEAGEGLATSAPPASSRAARARARR